MICDTGSSSARRTSSRAEDDGLRQAGEHVAAPDLGLHLFFHVPRRADLELDLLGGLLADEQLVVALDVVDDRLVHLVAADTQRLRDDDAAERDDGDLGRAAADVDDHVPGRLGDGKARADRSGHRLFDQVRLARAGAKRRFFDRALLHSGDARRYAHDDARVREAVLVHLLNEVAEHLLRDVEVGDHAVLQRADRLDRAGRSSEHALRLDADGVHFAGALVDRDDGRFGEDDAAAAHVDERVRRAEVHGHIPAPEAGYVVEDSHRSLPSLALTVVRWLMLIWAFHATVVPAPRHLASWHAGCPVPISDLRLVRLTYWGFDDRPHTGSLVVNRDAVRPVVRALRSLYEARFPIRRMRLVERYGTSDDRSMAADNTSAFNCRRVEGEHVVVTARVRPGDRRQSAREPVHLGARRPTAGRPSVPEALAATPRDDPRGRRGRPRVRVGRLGLGRRLGLAARLSALLGERAVASVPDMAGGLTPAMARADVSTQPSLTRGRRYDGSGGDVSVRT